MIQVATPLGPPKLIVKNFSCIDDAEIDLAHLVILIGPQASGKSVLSKLAHFFNAVPTKAIAACRTGQTYREFKGEVEARFREQFPPVTWHDKPFIVQIELGEYHFGVGSTGVAGSEKARATFDSSEAFKKLYTKTLGGFRKAAGSKGLSPEDDLIFRPADPVRNYTRRAQRLFSMSLGSVFVSTQIFVPAGRAIFTNIGNIIAAFNRGSILDPISREFGELYSFLRNYAQNRGRRVGAKVDEETAKLGRAFFGGDLRFKKQQEYVESEDGRKLPFNVLSSGQQELLPLWLSLEYFAEISENLGPVAGIREIFIEEPEAHLFPETQSVLIEYLATIAGTQKPRDRMLITTHSPYVLTKLNNLIFAFQVGQKNKKVEKVVPRSAWLDASQVRAYAIQDGKLRSILSNGLVDSDYLDSVSGQLSKEFDRLLEFCGK